MPVALGGSPPKNKKPRKARATRANKTIEKVVREQLLQLVADLQLDVENIRPLLEQGDPARLKRALRELQDRWRKLYSPRGDVLAGKWVAALSAKQKANFEKNLARSLGVDYTAVFDDIKVKEAAELAAYEASSLIKTIPDRYFDEVQRAVLTAYQQINLPEGRSLWQELQHIGGVSKQRAILIARDQTSKANIAITQARNEDVGVTEYIWRTAGDSRVVGNPSGLYPSGNKTHGNHFARNGKKFKWSEPPFDGHPGWAINCRCYAEPVIDFDSLLKV